LTLHFQLKLQECWFSNSIINKVNALTTDHLGDFKTSEIEAKRRNAFDFVNQSQMISALIHILFRKILFVKDTQYSGRRITHIAGPFG
jgi:hypothetical protein